MARMLARLLALGATLRIVMSARINSEPMFGAAVAKHGILSGKGVVDQHGQLSVSGNKIVDAAGNPTQLRGMSLFWSQWMPQYWNAETVKWLVDDWHVTMIRAAMGVEMGGYLENPAVEKARLEAVVDACIAAGIYVVIDWHDHKAEQHEEQAKAFFSEMARKYGSYPNVLFELFNEPEHQDWSGTIKPFHEAVIPVIRQHSENIIILGTRTWSQEVDEASKDPVIGENLAYTIHFYANTHKQSLRNKVKKALKNGIAVFATEWGTCSADGNGQLDLAETQSWLDFFAEHHISDANWAVSDKSEACSALVPGTGGSGGWSEDQLTPSGRFVRAHIRGEIAPTTTPERPAGCSAAWGQCGGLEWAGPECCDPGLTCNELNEYYSQCAPEGQR